MTTWVEPPGSSGELWAVPSQWGYPALCRRAWDPCLEAINHRVSGSQRTKHLEEGCKGQTPD